jgi:hypothetical protein
VVIVLMCLPPLAFLIDIIQVPDLINSHLVL